MTFWSDGFVLKWRILGAEKEGSLCGSDVLKWRVFGSEEYSFQPKNIFSDTKEETDDENVANDIRGDRCYQKFILIYYIFLNPNVKNSESRKYLKLGNW